MDIYTTGHPNWVSTNAAGVPDAFDRIARVGSKWNANEDPKVFKRHQLADAECKRRGVRFLPFQVMRPIIKAAGL